MKNLLKIFVLFSLLMAAFIYVVMPSGDKVYDFNFSGPRFELAGTGYSAVNGFDDADFDMYEAYSYTPSVSYSSVTPDFNLKSAGSYVSRNKSLKKSVTGQGISLSAGSALSHGRSSYPSNSSYSVGKVAFSHVSPIMAQSRSSMAYSLEEDDETVGVGGQMRVGKPGAQGSKSPGVLNPHFRGEEAPIGDSIIPLLFVALAYIAVRKFR